MITINVKYGSTELSPVKFDHFVLGENLQKQKTIKEEQKTKPYGCNYPLQWG